MPKFILIDPSIQDYQGHYFEYALRVVRAAEQQGFEGVVATNRKLHTESPAVRVRAVYRYGFWPSAKSGGWRKWFKRKSAEVKARWFGVRVNLRYSRVGLWWSVRHDWQNYLRLQSSRTGMNWWLAIPACLAYVAFAVCSAAAALTRLIPFRRSLGKVLQPVVQYVREGFREAGRCVGRVARPFAQALNPSGPVAEWGWSCVKLTKFASDTRRLVRLEAMQEGDHAVISTASPVELMALAKLLARDPASRRGTWHLVFRHNLHGRDAETAYDEPQRALRNAFLHFREQVPSGRVFFYTDTEELSSQYNALGILPFRTLPVPVDSEYFELRKTVARERPLTLSYVGDARREKGYALLPKLVGDLWERWVSRGAVRFQIQSNFSTPGGTPDVAVARAQLSNFPAEAVATIGEPLSPAAYREQVMAADLMLLPYEGSGYYARSSGIFAEALTAGIPSVAPAGTWMSMQLTQPHYEHHLALRKRSHVLETRRLPDSAWKIVGVPKTRPMMNGRLRITCHRRRCCQVATPRESNELLITFRQHTPERGQFVELQITQCGRGKRILEVSQQVVGGCTSGVSVLVKLDRRARSAQICVRNAYSGAKMELSDIRLDFLKTASREPRAAVGVVFQSSEDFTAAVAESLQHYDHYRATALAFSETWARRHSTERLIETFLAAEPNENLDGAPRSAVRAPHFLTVAPKTSLPRTELS